MGPRDLDYFRRDVLAGRVALISGGGSGIGFTIAQQLGRHGAKVCIMGRRVAFLEEAVKVLRGEGIEAQCVAGDVRSPEDCENAVQTAATSFGSLDILINNAAGNFLSLAENLSPNGFKTVMEIDSFGAFNLTTRAFPRLKESKFGGVVTSISATLHYAGAWGQTAAIAAKAGIDAMMLNLALEWAEYRIRCNCVSPGPVEDTPGLEKLGAGLSMDFINSQIPLGRAVMKEEVASICLYLCLNEGITGEKIVIDGGQWFAKPLPFPREKIAKLARSAERGSREMGPDAATRTLNGPPRSAL
eukprot:NODE_12639_length_1212_cov_7.603687.p1 GENE.NODE_12639_length_1212_cov_7.603687~~NODE_12639_length_1212_cov_7.603687.p1  ORF type:complete len:301 (-),score=104.90 NODE_12639_length_1212_cov_7.603687:246-1148(-)